MQQSSWKVSGKLSKRQWIEGRGFYVKVMFAWMVLLFVDVYWGEDASPVEEPVLQPVQKLLPRLLYRSVRQCKTNQGLHDCISSRSLYTKQLSISQETSRYRPLVSHPIYQIWINQILKVHTQSFSSKAKKKTKFPIRCTGLSRTFWHMHSYNKNTKGNQHGNDASCLLLIYPTTMVSRRGWRWGWLSGAWLWQCKYIFACSSAASLLSGEALFQSEYVQLHLWPEYRYIKSQKKLNLSINTVLIILWPVPFF